MKAKFYYQIKGTLYRYKNNLEDYIEINEVCKNDSPIIARERAFEIYQNYLDVMLDHQENIFENHNDVVLAAKDFISFEEELETKQLQNVIKTQDDYDKGICIYLIMSNSKKFTTLEGEMIYEDKLLIHDLNSEIKGLKEHMHSELLKEYLLYKKFNYEFKDYAISLPDVNGDWQYFLQTPINHTITHLLKLL